MRSTNQRTLTGASRRRRGVSTLLWVLALLVVAAIGVWAGRATLTPAQVPQSEPRPATYTVAEGEVGRSLGFPATASWDPVTLPAGSAAGVLTSVDVPDGALADSGAVLYTVDLRPVTLLQGEVPMFRDLTSGVQGPDVAQLRAFLRSAGYLHSAAESDRYDAATESAVRRWQRSLDVDRDGTVRSGDVVFAPSVPIRIVHGEARVGDQIGTGTAVVSGRSSSPRFSITLAVDQAATVPTEGQVTVEGLGHSWAGAITSATQTDENLVLELADEGGGPLCGEQCSELEPAPAGAPTVFQAEIVVVPQTSGPTVPVAAIGVDASGAQFVTKPEEGRVPVKVLASSEGLAVVEGVDVGDVVELIADDEAHADPDAPRG